MQAAIAGGGDLEAELRARAESARIGYRVRFLGNLSQDEIATWLATADIVAIPSVRDDSGNVDGLPNIVLEAMASGTPLISTPAGGIPSVVRDWHTGVIVPERNAEELAAAILSLARDPRCAQARRGRSCFGRRALWLGNCRRPLRRRLRSSACHDEGRPITCFTCPCRSPPCGFPGSRPSLP